MALLRENDKEDALLYWGWPLCTRTTYRFIEHYEKLPRTVRTIQRWTPFFKNGTLEPRVETTFPKGRISHIGLGCGYVSVIDEHGRVLTWGDNYAVRSAHHMTFYRGNLLLGMIYTERHHTLSNH